jgi:hypothetical protein
MYMRGDNIRITPMAGGDYAYSDQGPNRIEFEPLNEFTRPPVIDSSYVQVRYSRGCRASGTRWQAGSGPGPRPSAY